MRLVFCLVLSTAAVWSWPQSLPAQDPAALIKQVNSPDQATRLAALEALAAHPTRPKQALDPIFKSLDHADPLTRAAAAGALAAYGPRAKPAVPKLIKVLKGDKEPAVRASVARALGTLGAKDGPEVDALFEMITDTDPRVRRAALTSIRKLAPGPERSLPKFVKVLEDADPGSVVAALGSLAEFDAAAVQPMVKALQSEDAQYWALVVLGDIGEDAKDAVPQIVPLLSDPEEEVRMQTALTLAGIGKAAASAAPQVTAALAAEKVPGVQYAMIYALGRLGDPSARDTVAGFANAEDPMLQLLSDWAVWQFEPGNEELHRKVLDELTEALASDNVAARRAAAQALGEDDAAGADVIPLLIKALADPDQIVSRNAGTALVRKGAPAIDPLTKLLEDPNERPKAAFLLAEMGPAAKPAVPALVAALGAEKDPAIKRLMLIAVAQSQVDDPAIVPKLAAHLTDSEPLVVRSATYALGKMGPKAKGALAPITKNLDAEDPDTRIISVWALLQIAPEDKSLVAKAVPLLTKGLTHPLELARVEAATALGNLGAAAQTAVPALKELLEYDTAQVRAAAEEAIKKIAGAKAG